jgi:hypothetical protein
MFEMSEFWELSLDEKSRIRDANIINKKSLIVKQPILGEHLVFRAFADRKHGFVKVRAQRGSLTNCGRGQKKSPAGRFLSLKIKCSPRSISPVLKYPPSNFSFHLQPFCQK